MIKYVETDVVFREIPNEITLAINISNCPCHCKGCHSSYLAEDIGKELTISQLQKLILDNVGITCISFMGGDFDPASVNLRAGQIKAAYPDIKTAWYSGRQELAKEIELKNFDFIKLGPYIEELGPLTSKMTNQRFYKIIDGKMNDCTHLFWKSTIATM